jgi:flagellar motor switch protein FliM
MPYSMIEPIRELLDSGVQSDRSEGNESWTQTLREELEDVTLEIIPQLGSSKLTLRQVLALKAGDIIPCNFDGHATLLAEGVPFLRGTYGTSRGQQSVKIVNRLVKRAAPRPGAAVSS